jgi:hypothetical protein
MSKKLAEMLYEPEILVESAIKKLEHLSGFESTDVRLLAAANNKARTKLKSLGLDPDDTTGPELYHALFAKVAHDEQNLNLTHSELLKEITKAHRTYQVYALKQSVAKDLLRNHPPRKLMKQLSYRSVDSMLKRENIVTLFALVTSIESPRWLNVFWRDLAKVTSSDFETREISVIKVAAKYRSFDHAAETEIVPLLGALVIREMSESKLNLCVTITEKISELRSYCALIKLKNVEANFGNSLVDIIKNGAEHPLQISRLPVSWRSIFHHYGLRSSRDHTEFFGPHILHEDLKAHKPLAVLSNTSYVFNWWNGLEHVATKTKEGIVSFNLLDVIASRGQDFEQRSLDNFRRSLWHEFINRYFEHPSVEQHFMQQLEPQTVSVMNSPRTTDPEQEIKQLIEAGV